VSVHVYVCVTFVCVWLLSTKFFVCIYEHADNRNCIHLKTTVTLITFVQQ